MFGRTSWTPNRWSNRTYVSQYTQTISNMSLIRCLPLEQGILWCRTFRPFLSEWHNSAWIFCVSTSGIRALLVAGSLTLFVLYRSIVYLYLVTLAAIVLSICLKCHVENNSCLVGQSLQNVVLSQFFFNKCSLFCFTLLPLIFINDVDCIKNSSSLDLSR